MMRAWIAALIVVFGTLSPFALAMQPDSAGLVKQFEKALVEIFTIFRRKAAPDVMRTTEVHAIQSLKTGDRFFLLLVPRILPEKDGTFLAEAFWLADTSLLSKDKAAFGYEPEHAHLPLNRTTEEFFDRPLNLAMEWGALVSEKQMDDFIDFQGDTFLLSGERKVVFNSTGFNITKVTELEFAKNYKALSQLNGLIAGFSGPSAWNELLELNHSIYTWVTRAKETSCPSLLRRNKTIH